MNSFINKIGILFVACSLVTSCSKTEERAISPPDEQIETSTILIESEVVIDEKESEVIIEDVEESLPDKIEVTIESKSCVELGMLKSDECFLCQEIPDATCVMNQTLASGEQCFSCQEREIACQEIGLLELAECDLCDEIQNAQCVTHKQTKQGKSCYQCKAVEQVVDSSQEKMNIDEIELVSHPITVKDIEIDEVMDISSTEIQDVYLQDKNEDKIDEIRDISKLTYDEEKDYEYLSNYVDKPINEPYVEESNKIVIMESLLELTHDKEELVLKEIEDSVIYQEAQDTKTDLRLIKNSIEELEGIVNHSFKQEVQEHLDQREKFEVVRFEPEQEISQCSDHNLLSNAQCNDCSNCVFSKRLETGENCFSCHDGFASSQCPDNGYVTQCSSCQSSQFCQNTDVLVFSSEGKSPILNCFKCLDNI